MKKIGVFLKTIAGVGLPLFVGAQYERAPEVISGPEDFIRLIEKVGNWAFSILLVLAALFIIISGYYFVTAGGSEDRVKTARRMLIYALVGVAAGVLAKGLVMVIRGILQGGGGGWIV